jgi:hypothetical protein
VSKKAQALKRAFFFSEKRGKMQSAMKIGFATVNA